MINESLYLLIWIVRERERERYLFIYNVSYGDANE